MIIKFICPWSLPLKPLLVLILTLALSHAYNIDLPSYVRYRQASNSMFGFSIALHRGQSDYSGSQSNLIVGAPKYDTSRIQMGVIEAGGVFKCSLKDDDCQLVAFDSKGNNKNTQGETIDRKSYQWLGATVVTGRDNDLVVACAPRYVFHTMTPSRALRYDPVGTCFASHNFKQFHEISPCRTNNWGYHRQGSCQAGFSAAINSNGSRLFIGAPGSWYWQGQASSQDVTKPENQVFSTPESSSAYDDSYLGYSMITGDFDADRTEDVAIGMPRGANLLGKIVVNRWNMANIFNISGRQIGEYFGYSLATSDVDGDGLDDLIIGAPMYTEPNNVEGKYDVGRVYILLQGGSSPSERYTTEHIRDGFNTKGRFGLALTTLGDVNGDGYGDFAVGAPYDGPEGRGVVYLFHGSANGPLAKPSQVIMAEDLVEGAPYPRTFGFALSGGVDMDGNTYPDLAVGAYASDQVFIFKARPVAAVNAETSFASPSKLISLDDRKCQLQRDHKMVPCMLLTTCWSYTGRKLPSQLIFDVSWLLDAKKTRNPRMFFLRDEGKNIRNQTISLNYGQTYCLNETVYLVDKVQDKLTPLEVEARYNLRSNLYPQQTLVRRKREALEPVIDQNREIVLRDAINIQKNCGLDNICEPDLKLEIKTVDKYLFGSPEPLTIEVMITNNNEDAFEAAFYMVTPRDLEFRKLHQLDENPDTPVTCSAPTAANNHTLKCDIGNPLEANKLAHFKISLVPAEKFGSSSSYDFYFEANSTNLEKPGSHFDNIYRKSVGIWVDTDLSIKGTSLPDYQLYKADDYKSVENATAEEDLGPQVVHIYEIRNNRPSIIEEAVVYIHYPYETIAGDPLMYLLNQPETGGRIHCDMISEVNERQLKLDTKLQRKSYLHAQGAISNSVGHTSSLSGSSSAGSGDASVKINGESESSGGHVEISQGSNQAGQGGVAVSNERRFHFTTKQKDLLEREDAQDATGDASYVHQDRANQAQEVDVEHELPLNHSTLTTSSSSSYTSTNGQLPSGQLRGHSTHGYIQMANGAEPPIVTSSSSQQYRNQQFRLPNNEPRTIHYAGVGGVGGAGGGQSGNFHTSTFELGPINRGNVDNELYRSHAPVGGYQQQQHRVVHNKPSYYGRENEDYYDEDNQGGQGLGQGQGHQQWSSSSSSSSQRRVRREEKPTQIDLNSPCQAAKCRTIRCEVTNLGSEDIDAAFVAIRARMVAKTMEKLASNVPLNVSTLAVANVTKLPFIGQPKDQIVKSHEVFYKAEPEPLPVPDVISLWIVVLSACAGALILLLLIFLLYKCGFFNRNRPTDHSQERQPLRNGYHGDEHL